jgi:hypothetical protein
MAIRISAQRLPCSVSPRTSRIEYQPCRPCTQRAARKAPCAKVERSRTVWVNVTVEANGVRARNMPRACRRYVDVARQSGLSHGIEQQERRTRWRIALLRMMRLVQERLVVAQPFHARADGANRGFEQVRAD